MHRYAYVKNAFVPIADAKISVEERGFRFGDGVFETITIYDGVPYQWEWHMKRLSSGCEALKIPADVEPLKEICAELIRRNCGGHCVLRIYISRGIGSRGYLPYATERSAGSTLVIETFEKQPEVSEPVSLWLSSYEKPSSTVLPVEHKLAQGLNSTLARMEAMEHGCFEALQLGSQGQIAEASAANIFWREEGHLYTPSLECGCLAGTTREAVLRLSPSPIKQGVFGLDALARADAVFLTNAGFLVAPVQELKPQNMRWNSEALSAEVKAWLKRDIAAYVEMHRPVTAA